MPNTANSSELAKQRIAELLTAWLFDEKHKKALQRFIENLTPQKIREAAKAMDEAMAPVPSTLSQYIAWFRDERDARAMLMQRIAPRKKDAAAMQTAILRLGKTLSKKEIKRALRTDASLAEYLASLSVAQLEAYKEAVEKDVIPLEPRMKKTFTMLFTKLQREQFAREQDWLKTVGALATGITKAMEIQQRIDALEQLDPSLRSA